MRTKRMSVKLWMNNAVYALVCSWFACVPATANSAEYDLVRDENGRVLGMNYVKDGNITRGELGIHRSTNFLLFVPCQGFNIRFGEKYFRRRVNNCSNRLALWPENLLTYITLSLSGPITLTGPKTNCGACMESPFADFQLPEGVEIIGGDVLNQIAENLDPRDGSTELMELVGERMGLGPTGTAMPGQIGTDGGGGLPAGIGQGGNGGGGFGGGGSGGGW